MIEKEVKGLDKIEKMALLFDFYGKLLTEKQQEMLTLYYDQDLSLSEIAEEYHISRQAVHDNLRRAEKLLEDYETKLGLVKKFNIEREKLAQALSLIDEIKGDRATVQKIKKMINEILEIEHSD